MSLFVRKALVIMRRFIQFIFISLLLFSCAAINPYTKFYKDSLGGKLVSDIPELIVSTDEPKIYSSNDLETDLQRLTMNNYALIGYSSFNAGSVNQKGAIEHGKTVGASLILVTSKYTNTVSGNIPLELPNTEKSTTRHSGRVGSDYFSGTSNTTTQTTKTYNIPYNTRRYDYGALFFVKHKPLTLGISYSDIPMELRKTIKRNRGVYVKLVMNDSPAFYADLIPDDVIVKVGEIETNNAKEFKELLKNYKGQKTKFEIIRDGQKQILEIQLN